MFSSRFNVIKSRWWSKDYYTSALPWVQRGIQALLPATGVVSLNMDTTDAMLVKDAATGTTRPTGRRLTAGVTVGGRFSDQAADGTGSQNNDVLDPNGRLSSTTSISINDLRRTSAIQRFLENNAVGGARYIEQILAHFNVVSSDSRLQRAEFLSAGKSPVHFSEIAQTSGSNIQGQSTPQGNLAGHGIGGGINHGFRRRFEEHGFIVMFASLTPRPPYIS